MIHATTQGESCTTAGPARRVAGAQDRADFERPWSPRAPAFMFQPPAVDCASCVFCPLLFSFPLLPLPVSLRRTTSQRFQHRLWGYDMRPAQLKARDQSRAPLNPPTALCIGFDSRSKAPRIKSLVTAAPDKRAPEYTCRCAIGKRRGVRAPWDQAAP